jgi:predicted DNA-binding protein YlxM (UPF0122 family)
MKITIKRYAENEGISVQSVYAQIKRGSLKSIEENGIKYVLLEDKTIKPKVENTLKKAFKIIKRLQKEIKLKDKEIKRLTKKNEKQNTFLISKYENALPKPNKDDIVDIKVKKKKKKRRACKN